MKINQKLQPVLLRSLCNQYSRFNVIIATTEAVAFFIKRIIPYSYADVINSAFCESLENVLLIAIPAVEFHPGVFQGDYRADVSSHDKILRQLYLAHIERF